jgi:hypothetical protein
VIRFSAVLVIGAIGVLIGGIVTSKLLLVYVAIGLSAAALVALAIGVVLKREELFSEQGQALAPATAGAGADEPLLSGKPSTLPNGLVDPPDTPPPAPPAAAFGQAARGAGKSGKDRSGHQAFGQPAHGQAAPPAREAPPSRDQSGRMARQPNPPRREQRAGGPAPGQNAPAPGQYAPAPGRSAPAPGQYARPFRSGGPWPPAAPATAPGPLAPRPPAPRPPAPRPPAPRPPAPAASAAPPAAGADAKKAGASNAGSSESGLKQVTVVPGVPRYHDEDCILIRFMADDDLHKMTLRQATEVGCTPCRACQPGTEAP